MNQLDLWGTDVQGVNRKITIGAVRPQLGKQAQ